MNYEIVSQDLKHEDCILFNGEVFTYKNEGLTRRVYANASKTLVVKVPIHSAEYNVSEAQAYQDASDKSRLAQTELVGGYIVQEYLHTLDDASTPTILGRHMTPAEVRFAARYREQVGFDKNGVLKIYDLHELF